MKRSETVESVTEDRAFTYATLAERWACSEAVLYAMVRRGELRTFQVGRATRISAAEVRRIENGEAAIEGHKR